MVTALVLQLIQCVVVLPQTKDEDSSQPESDDEYNYDEEDDAKKSREVRRWNREPQCSGTVQWDWRQFTVQVASPGWFVLAPCGISLW